MWASSAATEIMNTPWSESIETSIRSRRALITHPRSGALYARAGSKRRTGSSSGSRLGQEVGARITSVEGLRQLVGPLLLLLRQALWLIDLEPVADVPVAA